MKIANRDRIHSAFDDAAAAAHNPGWEPAQDAINLLSSTFLDTRLPDLYQALIEADAADKAAVTTVVVEPDQYLWDDDDGVRDQHDETLRLQQVRAAHDYSLYLAGMRSVWERVALGDAERHVTA
ncbi:hypothetical protein [Rhodomicrobium udaipurense]|uniref:Uncharacterized protein n=1 Tax=Rhodomicrobium udaipurense TaxID=1202716 RepID=A0A8I1GHQ2_9HYPH|nr:hypothetical protein [Rhodomicrobium udaipurense]MBJ7543292.1 hypothetical protein [Rhodomicrobium udaipurense]